MKHDAKLGRERKLLAYYKLTPKDYNKMLREQGYRCGVCRKKPASKPLSVDHDHSCCPGRNSCGECVRGLLCNKCNMGIGLLDDNPARVLSAHRYLTKPKEKGL